ncbi:MAG: chromosome segregation protein SMC [Candidatus Micrarchaeota archaeon]|nr:chromosome segregation protein SMC [Candidatus Micrarchaeota archaeon]MDE1848284.1 chromosome segregation protein SMC [Candidatus Micrarchaeota archaeon]MDE1864313.1 chromosome segregation protein SMC [Candidatus Micrarchaeota archaeon]
MLYLKSLTLSKFKSFKHAELLFSKGFTCIVGPNGSGKSNICDALLFSLGESAIRRMRAERLEMLINSDKQSRHDPQGKTYVKSIFDGDEQIEIVRVASADGKSSFKVNGKHMTRQEVLEILKKHKVNADETNTITQGEINKMMDINPKERRELIEIASGITEFEAKKNDSLRELGKVNIKTGEVQAILNERQGYLRELEKEKEAAESYNGMNLRLRTLKYSMLASREQEIKQNYDRQSRDLALLDSKKQKIMAELGELLGSIEKLTADRQQMTKEMSESTVSTSFEGRKLEGINKELAVICAGIDSNAMQMAEKQQELARLRGEAEAISLLLEANRTGLLAHKRRILELEPQIGEVKEEAKGENWEARLGALNDSTRKLEKEFAQMQGSISLMQADLSATKNAVSELISKLQSLKSQFKEKQGTFLEVGERAVALLKNAEKLDIEIAKSDAELTKSSKEIGEIDEKSISLKEQRAIYHSRESSAIEKLSGNFGAKEGFYGRVSQLCTYSSASALAIEAAAGGRFEYLVVDSIESASKIIAFLKKNDLGRATFIPINDLAFDGEKKKAPGLTPVIEMVKFDSKYAKVFDYVFSNTYVLGAVEDAKKAGVGRHRYVTLEGELVEQSGVLSGGSQRRRVSLSSIENQIKELASSKAALLSRSEELAKSLFKLRKEKSLQELERAGLLSQQSSIKAEASEIEQEIKKIESSIKSQDSKIKQLDSQISESISSEDATEKELVLSRAQASELYSKSIEAVKSIAKHGMSKEEKERLGNLRAEIEELKIKATELQTQSQMSEKRGKEVDSQGSSIAKSIESLRSQTKESQAKKILLDKEKLELEEKIKSSSASSKRAYERLEEIEAKIAKLSSEKGKRSAEHDESERQINEIRLKRSQYEVRLTDIQAELATYPAQTQRAEVTLEEMEKEASLISIKVSQLGTVNLKAPEIYQIKKKDVEEAGGRLETLIAEKDAILKMIEEIDSKKLSIFAEAFDAINKNFTKLHGYINPNKALIELDSPKDPFNSGLHFKIPEGKGYKRENAMSGGEKSLANLTLLFSIHTYKPSSLYIFDEVDSALDKENSKILSKLIKEMSKSSQFIVVSHNDSLIVNSDTAIGVSKTDGESRAVGLQLASMASRSSGA